MLFSSENAVFRVKNAVFRVRNAVFRVKNAVSVVSSMEYVFFLRQNHCVSQGVVIY